YSVSHLSSIIRRLIEDGLPYVWVEGEISNLTLHGSGHRYFSLKDQNALISCVMWRTRKAPTFNLENGLKVRVYGKVTVWERGGRYQFDVQSVMPAGVGSLQAAFEELKRKLDVEGLFDQAHKKPLPDFPCAIGIVTSLTGAAVRDLVWGFNNRFPPTDLYIIPVKVQGEGSASEISAAISAFNRLGLVDLIVVGRGGGSIEDLWAFNEEQTVRAVVNSTIPVVSAVGHEVDVTLCDLAADRRAPTPTAAASIAVPDRNDLKSILFDKNRQLLISLERTVTLWRERVKGIEGGYALKMVFNRLSDERLRLDLIGKNIESQLIRKTHDFRQGLDAISGKLNALSPRNVLERGYCMAKNSDGVVVRNSADVRTGDRVYLTFRRGGAKTLVEEVYSE
ncbi:MAG: exodeoxyribonuclease VII large subunit, partial [Calditrichaeota bacterium]|nr:exodeoxyribonuclease VII large subunit [Calditrichota bacterium]